MFNYGQYKRQLQMSKTVEKIKKDYMEERDKRKDLNNKLSQNYRKRVENFVINMLENPIAVTDYKGPQHESIRDESPQKFMADANIYVKGFKHEKDRITEAQEKNKDLDFLPNQIIAMYQFRQRDIGKEIQPDMRFKDRTSLERIEQFLKDHTQTQVENMHFNKSKKNFKIDSLSESMSIWEKRAYIARHIAKNLLPSLHQKTHFQAAQSLYNNLPVSLCENQRLQQNPPSLTRNQNEQQDNPDIESKQNRQPRSSKNKFKKDVKVDLEDQNKEKNKVRGDQMETFNPIETSKQVLSSCNILRKKNPKVKQIREGDGHLISTLDRSVSEMYMDIYNIDLTQHKIGQRLRNKQKFNK